MRVGRHRQGRLAGREINQGWRFEGGILDHPERRLQDGVLASGFVWRVERVSVTERDEESPRRADPFRDRAQQLDRDRRNAATLQLRCDQAHGLVAHRSDRHEECNVHLIFNQGVNGCGSGIAE